MLAEEREHLAPAVERLLHAVHRPVVIEKAMARAIITMELVILSMLLQLGLVLVHLGRRRALVVVAEQAEQRAAEVLRHLDRSDRAHRIQQLRIIDHDVAAVQILADDNPRNVPATIHCAYWPTENLRPHQPIMFSVRCFRTSRSAVTVDFGDGSAPVHLNSKYNVSLVNKDRPAAIHARRGYVQTRHRYPKPGYYTVTAVVTILAAYAPEIDELKRRGGFVTADVVDVYPDTPNLDAMLAMFAKEHTHTEDEVRFILKGAGLFHIHPENGPVFAIQVEAGDLINVPKGIRHWFNLCADKTIRAIRLFQNPAGWTPVYEASPVSGRYQPLCFGPAYIASLPADSRLSV